mmetsp:Transcript_14216/g.21016  ORF Transcript_14216/g.21016 Transcript_14216/m.21016 type:complete len:247 (-) Transcript_14216:99-839(-)
MRGECRADIDRSARGTKIRPAPDPQGLHVEYRRDNVHHIKFRGSLRFLSVFDWFVHHVEGLSTQDHALCGLDRAHVVQSVMPADDLQACHNGDRKPASDGRSGNVRSESLQLLRHNDAEWLSAATLQVHQQNRGAQNTAHRLGHEDGAPHCHQENRSKKSDSNLQRCGHKSEKREQSGYLCGRDSIPRWPFGKLQKRSFHHGQKGRRPHRANQFDQHPYHDAQRLLDARWDPEKRRDQNSSAGFDK